MMEMRSILIYNESSDLVGCYVDMTPRGISILVIHTYSTPPASQPQTPPSGISNPQTLTIANPTAPSKLTPPRTCTSTTPRRFTSSLKSHRPSGSLESKRVALYLCPPLSCFSSPCLTTAHSALGAPSLVMIVPALTSSPTRSSSHFARSLRCRSSNLSRSLRRLLCRSVAHFATRISLACGLLLM